MNCFPLEKHHMNFKSNCGNQNYLSLSNQYRHVNKTVLFTQFIPALFTCVQHAIVSLDFDIAAVGDNVINNTIQTPILVAVLLSARNLGTGRVTRKLNR
jgi:hypothetical protein